MPRTTNRSVATLGSALIAWLWLGPSAVTAQRAVQPRVSVVTFEGSGASREARDAMADELAARLVDTGRFRVLHREWLPHENDEVPALDVLRTAAKSVSVDYLVLGTIRQATMPRPRSGVLTSNAFGVPFERPLRLPRPPAHQQVPPLTTLVVDVHVIDVMTADVVRSATAERTFASSSRSPSPALLLLRTSRHPAVLAAAIATTIVRSKRPPAGLPKDWRQVIQVVAQQLDVRGIPASGSR